MSRARQILQVSAFLLAALMVRIGWEGYQRFAGHEVAMRVVGLDGFELARSHTSPLVFEDRLRRDMDCPTLVGNRERALIFGGHWLTLKIVQDDGLGRRGQATSASKSGMDAKASNGFAVIGTATCQPLADGITIQYQLGIDRLNATPAEAAAIQAALRRVPSPPQTQAILSIGRDGRARLMGVIVNGQRIDLKNWPRR